MKSMGVDPACRVAFGDLAKDMLLVMKSQAVPLSVGA
jgi:hypothetical protein